jgi:LuxR family maltose regulon positive regulatory protein
MCEDGVEPMLAAVESALGRLPADDRWRPYGLLLQGTARALLGENERGDAILSRAVHAAERLGSTETRVLALTQRSLLATARGERPRADALLGQAMAAMDDGGLQTYPTCALTLALSARSHLLCGHAAGAASALKTARRLAAGLTVALPWLAVQCQLELARACVTVRDAAAARAILKEVDDLIAARPKLGVLREERDRIGDELRLAPIGGTGRATSLTGAELKLLPMLATHLSFREIGLRFFLSRNTVKTQAISVYRKLGASNRSEAVERAHMLGLIDPGLDSASLILNG